MLGRNTEHTRTLRKTLVCTLLLSILLITLNMKPAYAQSISLSVSSGQVDLVVNLTGSGFSSSDTSCTISGTPVAGGISNACTISLPPGSGNIVGSFVVANVPPGPYAITVTGNP